MQTFLPFPDFEKSAKVLDYRRLGKQRVEGKQILDIIEDRNPQSRWRNHPAVKMWMGYSHALRLYVNIMITEWIYRKYKNTMTLYEVDLNMVKYPPWFGRYSFHIAHQSNLLRKNYYFYRDKFEITDTTLPYEWS